MTTNASAVQEQHSTFYFRAALACVAVAFLGFTPTYFAPVVQGSFRGHPIAHLHGIVFFCWTLLFAYQTWLVANSRTARHRDAGLIGISLATAMIFLGLMMAVDSVARGASAGFLNDAKQFMVVPVTGITMFAFLVAIAIANLRNSDVHRRLMLVATATILDADVARWFLTFLEPPPVPGASPVPPVAVALPPALLVDLFIIAGIVHDWRTRGRPHPAYLIAGAAVLLMQLLRAPIATSATWNGIADWLIHVTG